ncbi:MAG: zinc-binding dehydrogenase [Deltaproteobacteria bacterium]
MPTSNTYSRYVIDRFGDVEALRLQCDESLPSPGPAEVRITISASSVQFTDTIIRRGKYPDAGKPPIIPGYDFVGRIDALGAGVTTWSLGDRVADMCTIGANASHIIRPASDLTRVPDSLDAAEACALILSGVTAWQLLFRHAHVARGERILVQGGNGGVGWFAVQFALSAGLHVWAAARSEHHAGLRALGATPLDYRDPNYPAQLRTEAAGGVDWVVDGQGADGFMPSLACLRRGGKLVFIGASEAVNQGQSMIATGAKLLARNLIPWGPRIGLYSVTVMRKRHPEWFKEDLAKLFDKLERKSVVVRIDRRIGFDGVPAAHRALQQGGVSGKIVLILEG